MKRIVTTIRVESTNPTSPRAAREVHVAAVEFLEKVSVLSTRQEYERVLEDDE